MSPSSAPALKSASRCTSDATAKLSAAGGAETRAFDAEDDVADSSSTSREMMCGQESGEYARLPSSSSPQPTRTVAYPQTAGENELT
eukprot:3503978-Prymnesium_polylepis.1